MNLAPVAPTCLDHHADTIASIGKQSPWNDVHTRALLARPVRPLLLLRLTCNWSGSTCGWLVSTRCIYTASLRLHWTTLHMRTS